MSAGQSILFLLAGIGIFIFSLKLIEEALRNFASRSFKLFLRRTTTNKVYTVLGSAVITALVQGSSVVMIMVLALVGAGVLPMSAALAVMLGANLGTTLDSWLVASLGFKVSVDAFAYPAIVLATFLNLFVSRERWKHFADFLFGFGFLFISINMMKMSVSDWVTGIDLSLFNDTPLWQFVFLGILVTALVQSSLATMTIVLSALHAGAIQFDVAAAIVLGSEVGTTLKILIGAMDGYAPKKRLALGNFMVNSFTALVGFVFLHPLLYLVSHGLNVKDPLVGLVTFQSIINLLSVVVFLPVLNPLSLFLSKFFKEEDTLVTSFVKKEDLAEPGT
ncbi:MAG: Na/Pi cotransporter family protein, partial [Bacteroidia bacterium]|nr:Na/Pi cotransporter family protein [Bacteroidia bacterium]